MELPEKEMELPEKNHGPPKQQNPPPEVPAKMERGGESELPERNQPPPRKEAPETIHEYDSGLGPTPGGLPLHLVFCRCYV